MEYKPKKIREEIYITSMEDEITEEDEVRVIDIIVDKLNLEKLGYKKKARKSNAGCGRYPEKEMMKLYVYGYRNGIRSGRRLEEACKYDKRCGWLMSGLKPDKNTINDFRRENIKMIEKAFYEINRMYIEMGILEIKDYSQDGVKVKAVNSKEKNYTRNKVMDRIKREKGSIEKQSKKIKEIEKEQEKVETYLKGLEIEEEKENAEEELKRIKEEIAEYRKELEEYTRRKEKHEKLLSKMQEEGTSQISLTDKESKLMKNNGRYDVAYNNQLGVDSKTHLTIGIVTDNNPGDVGSMNILGSRIKEEYGKGKIQSNTTDKGYNSKEDMVECLENGIVPQVTPNEKGQGYVELETEYEENEITRDMKESTKEEDIKKCLRSGVIPECYKEIIEDIKIEETRKYEKIEDEKEEKETRSSDEIRKEAMEKQKFIKDRNTGSVVCPMGENLNKKAEIKGKDRYANKMACKNCKNPCTLSKYKTVDMKKDQIEVYPKKSTLEKPRQIVGKKKKIVKKKKVKFKLKLDKEKLKKRMSISEHSQGTMKTSDNFSSFSMRGKEKASGEIALHFISSNIRRVVNMIGVLQIIEKLNGIGKKEAEI